MKLRIKTFVTEYYHYLVLALLFIIQMVIAFNVDLYGDDFYYANFTQEGIGYFISENIFHYNMTNGRCWVHLLDELLLCNGSIILWRLLQPFAVILTVFYGAKLASGDEKEKFKTALVMFSLSFTFIDILNANQSVYWATGSLNYFLPALLLICLAYQLVKAYRKGKLPFYVIILAVFACSSTEQCAFASVVFVLVYFLLNIKKNKGLRAIDFILLVLSLAAMITLFLAPGNGVREGYYPEFYSQPMLSRIISNLRPLLTLIFDKSGIGNYVVLFFASSIFSILGKDKKPLDFVFLCVSNVGLALQFVNMFVFQHLAILIITVASFAAVCVYHVINWAHSGEDGKFFILILLLALVMQGAMLISPIYGGRTTLASGLLLMVLSGKIIVDSSGMKVGILAAMLTFGLSVGIWYVAVLSLAGFYLIALYADKSTLKLVPVLVVLACMILLRNQLTVALGYAENHRVIKENYKLIEEFKNSEDEVLEQHYLINGYYKYTMPYESSYHEWWYKKLNGIGEEVPIKYTVFPTK
ncbi:MAG: DUF6056 family protein [Clostridiales bacterium]|nr:DUF6056 family protein [Clostridiales bacterium]